MRACETLPCHRLACYSKARARPEIPRQDAMQNDAMSSTFYLRYKAPHEDFSGLMRRHDGRAAMRDYPASHASGKYQYRIYTMPRQSGRTFLRQPPFRFHQRPPHERQRLCAIFSVALMMRISRAMTMTASACCAYSRTQYISPGR